jgi:hypothetical protein
LIWPQSSRGAGKISFNYVCATRKTQFSNGSKRGFPFGRDLRWPTQTQSALIGVYVAARMRLWSYVCVYGHMYACMVICMRVWSTCCIWLGYVFVVCFACALYPCMHVLRVTCTGVVCLYLCMYVCIYICMCGVPMLVWPLSEPVFLFNSLSISVQHRYKKTRVSICIYIYTRSQFSVDTHVFFFLSVHDVACFQFLSLLQHSGAALLFFSLQL